MAGTGRKRGTLALALSFLGLGAAPSVHDLQAQYRFSCAQCHGLDGSARGPSGQRLPGRVLADRRWLAKRKEEELVRSILEGKGAMPAFKHKLTAADAARLLTEILRPLARKAGAQAAGAAKGSPSP